MYAIIDIETTGLSHKKEKITEIAIIQHNGKEVTHRYSTLINPECKIPYRITQMTGINNMMVEGAPKFYEIAKDIIELTQGRTIVGHNVTFDYNFIKAEFKSLAYDFQSDTICTVRKSRKLIPNQASYSLGKLCNSLGIENSARHRAMGDAEATATLFDLLLSIDEEQVLDNKKGSRKKEKILPIDHLPEQAGVYFFHDKAGEIIYIGKSINIRSRVLSHLNNHLDKKTVQMREAMSEVTFEITGTELSALLYESFLIKKHLPKYNRAQRRTAYNWGLYSWTDDNGYINLKVMKQLDELQAIQSYSSQRAAKEHLEHLCEEFNLCQKLCQLYKTSGACFHYQIKECKGACLGEEPSESYNERVLEAIEHYRFEQENFFIAEPSSIQNQWIITQVEQHRYIGFGTIDEEVNLKCSSEELSNCIKSYPDNKDVRQIIRTYLRQNQYTVHKLDSNYQLYILKK